MISRRATIIGSVLGSAAMVAALAVPAMAATPAATPATTPAPTPPLVSVPLPPDIPGPPVLPPSTSPVPNLGSLDPGHPVLNFNGAVDDPTPLPVVSDPAPPVCAVECSEYRFQDNHPGTPFLASIKNTLSTSTFDPNDGYDLYVYDPAGKLIATSNGVGANGQAAMVQPDAAGIYTVMVAVTYAYEAGAGWLGEVRLITPGTWTPAAATCNISVSGVHGCFDLPSLRVVPPYDFAVGGLPPVVSTPLGFPLPVSAPTANSCYLDESIGLDNPSVSGVQHPVTRCLRFTSDIQNIGAGAVSVGIPLLTTDASGTPQSGYLPGECHAVQYVTGAGGNTVTRPAGDCEFHAEHGHFHYDALLAYSLHALDPATGGIGSTVSVSHKESFCLTDDDYFGYGTAGPNGPHEYVGQPNCNAPQSLTTPTGGPGTGTYVTEGINPGWGDVYTWDTPDQFIDVTNVPTGTYWLVEETNPSGSILVAGSPQTCSATKIQLTSGTSSDTVTSLQSVSGVACPTG